MRLKRADTAVGVGLALLATLVGGSSANAAVAPSMTAGRCTELEVESQAGSCGPAAQTFRSGRHGRRAVRYGRIVDTDNAYGDNQFHVASGKAFCKHGEQVITGGKQVIGVTGLFGGPARTAPVEDAPYLIGKRHGWSIAFESDLGGLGRKDFRVMVVCER